MPKALLIRNGKLRNFAYTFVTSFPRSTVLDFLVFLLDGATFRVRSTFCTCLQKFSLPYLHFSRSGTLSQWSWSWSSVDRQWSYLRMQVTSRAAAFSTRCKVCTGVLRQTQRCSSPPATWWMHVFVESASGDRRTCLAKIVKTKNTPYWQWWRAYQGSGQTKRRRQGL